MKSTKITIKKARTMATYKEGRAEAINGKRHSENLKEPVILSQLIRVDSKVIH
jgi:hypothetical protein